MKKIFLFILSVMFCAFTLAGCDLMHRPDKNKPDVVYGNLDYEKVMENGEVVGYEVVGLGTYSSYDVLIPETYMDEPVIGIGDNAFAGLAELRSIDMFSSVTYIGDNAFESCTNLQTVGLSKNITRVGRNCFYGCDILTYNGWENGRYLGNDENPYMLFVSLEDANNFKLNENTKLIYSSAFAHSNITSINITKNVMSFSGLDFLDCKSLTSVMVDSENSVYSAQGNAVIRTEDNALVFALDDVDLSTLSVEKICGYAFSNWNKTGGITIGDSVEELEDSAFAYGKFNCINLPATIGKIGSAIFYSCPNLVTIGDFQSENYYCANNTIVDIKAKSVLAGCQSSVIPTDTNVTKIDKNAFFYCEGLKEITIPENIVLIDDRAFYWCVSLETINFSNKLQRIGENAFSLCSSLKNVKLNDGLKIIRKGAFSSSALETITIPTSVESIEENAFRNCNKLKTVYYASTYDDFLKIAMGEGNEKLFTAEQVFGN